MAFCWGPGWRASWQRWAVLRAIETGGKPWVAAINGNALGGGYELCLACHRRLLLDDGAIRVGLPERSVGLIPGGGGTQRLPRLIGIPAAMRLMLEANILAPAGALAAGLVDELQPTPESLLHAAHDWVLAQTEPAVQPWDQKGWRLPGGSGAMAAHASETFGLGLARVRGGPVAQRASGLALLEAVYEGAQLPIVRALALEAKVFAALVAPPVEGEHACDR
jgi:enoyl-CoA hydratase/carnithine racemase